MGGDGFGDGDGNGDGDRGGFGGGEEGGSGSPVEVTEYEWNDQGMLVKVILPNGEPVEYQYDGNQRLISRKSSDGVDNFVQSGWDIMTKTDDVGKRTYYTGSSAVESGDSVKYFHYNHRGDTVLVTDSEGNILNNFSYEAYGKLTNNEGIPFNSLSLKDLPNLFTGASGIRYDTKTDLHYMRFRWFSSTQMRFISPDLLMDLNRYAYVGGEPIRHTDVTGLKKDQYVVNGIVCNDVIEFAGEYFFSTYSINHPMPVAISDPGMTQFGQDIGEFTGYGLSESGKWLDRNLRAPVERAAANTYKDWVTFGSYGIPEGEPGAGETLGLIKHSYVCHGRTAGSLVASLSVMGIGAALLAALLAQLNIDNSCQDLNNIYEQFRNWLRQRLTYSLSKKSPGEFLPGYKGVLKPTNDLPRYIANKFFDGKTKPEIIEILYHSPTGEKPYHHTISHLHFNPRFIEKGFYPKYYNATPGNISRFKTVIRYIDAFFGDY